MSRSSRAIGGICFEQCTNARHRDHHPALEVAAIAVHDVAQYGIFEYCFGGGRLLEKFEQLVVLEDASVSIYMQPDLIRSFVRSMFLV
jgi:hypothetical protein